MHDKLAFADDAMFVASSNDEMINDMAFEISELNSIPIIVNTQKSDLDIICDMIEYLSTHHTNIKNIVIR